MIEKAKIGLVKDPVTKISVKEYAATLAAIKRQVQETQIRSTLSANKELIKLYWSIGKIIVEKQQKNGWGSNVIETLAQDLQNSFSGVSGFSRANIFKMRSFYLAYEKVSQPVRLLDKSPLFNLPWGHNIILVTKLKDNNERLWYAQKAIEYGWSRSMLEMWIASDLYAREGRALTNFQSKLPKPDSDLANQSLKDPYLFDFLMLGKEHMEHEIEQGLIDHIQKFLLELGQGFAFVGRQVHLHIGNKDYYIDLLFYHVKLRCFVIVEIKAREFDPRDTGQIGFYLSAVDHKMKHIDDKPTIGLILCKNKDNLTVEYALRASSRPIGVASYYTEIVESLPKDLRGSLPTIQEIEAELEKQKFLKKSSKKSSIKNPTNQNIL